MRGSRLAVCGALAVVGSALATWLAVGRNDPGVYLLPDPPFLKEPLAARDLDGEKVDLRAPASGAALIVFDSVERPAAAAALPAVSRLVADLPAHRLLVVGICVDPDMTGEAVGRHARERRLGFLVVHDRDGALAHRFGVETVPEAFVLDEEGYLRYRGRIDGPHGADLHDAVAALLAGRPAPPIPERPRPSNQTVAKAEAKADAPTPTYHRDVAPILRRSCQACHQPGRSGPFSLLTYAQASKRADDLADVAERRLMPPWKPTPEGPPLRHDRTLLPSEIRALRAWADAGSPEGPRVAEPPEAVLADGVGNWSLGAPDLVLEMDRPFDVPAAGDDLYRCFVLPTALPEDRFLTAIEVLPGNPRVVHHTFGYVDNRSLGRERDAADPLPGYPCFSGFAGDQIFGLLGGWTPGNEAHPFGDGVGLELPRGADVVVQIHYHPSGKPESDRTRLGLYFSKTPIRQALEWVSACPDARTFRLPAGEPDVRVSAMLEVPINVELHAMTPHMHLLGRRFRASVKLPGGRTRPLIAIDDWDFNRQETYYLRDPLPLPAGSVLEIEGWYDNSSANPRNPNHPPREVRWGEATTDDMLILFLALTQADQDLTRPGARSHFMEEFFRDAGTRSEHPPGPSTATSRERPAP